MLLSLKHLKSNGILHADIKPDNILVDKNRKIVKICDLGSAMLSEDIEITPYLVSRFYRPPEVILGLSYDTSMDMWSIGCVIFELFAGRILFPGKTNNDMIRQIMDLKGPIPKKNVTQRIFYRKAF
jgi:serine/threonine-protein kinase PRP4